MARSLDQILAEVTARSDPQRNIVLGQISSLPTQQAADESSLVAKKDQAYEDITAGARRKGLGFSGIPLGEQAKYAATEYAPALANLKTSYGGRKSTLEMALADIGKNDYSSAYNMFNQDRSFEESQRQFNENLELQRQQLAAQQAAARAGTPSPSLGSTQEADPFKVKAQNDVANLLTKDAGRIQREFDAIAKSAGYGNVYDKLKLQLLQSYGYKPSSNRPNTLSGSLGGSSVRLQG
jgi:hypothetical protein